MMLVVSQGVATMSVSDGVYSDDVISAESLPAFHAEKADKTSTL